MAIKLSKKAVILIVAATFILPLGLLAIPDSSAKVDALAPVHQLIHYLDDLIDVNASAPADDNFLYWNSTDSQWHAKLVDKRFYMLPQGATCIWKCWNNPVSSTPRTATVQSISGDEITLTGNDAYRFGEWGDAPENMNAGSVKVLIRNLAKMENAWVIDGQPHLAANKLKVSNPSNISSWQNGDTIVTRSNYGGDYVVELDISPLIPDGATGVFLKMQNRDSGAIGYATGQQVSKDASPGSWSNVFCQVTDLLICGFPSVAITTDRHIQVRDRATGMDTLMQSINVIAYIM